MKTINETVNSHGVFAFPTETVMGLGVVYNDFEAYTKLNIVKHRKENKPYTMMLFDVHDIEKYAFVDIKIEKVIQKYMPGSLTVLLKAKNNVPGYVTHETGVIGIRIPSNKEALDLLKEVNVPLLVPSANIADQKPCMSSEEVLTVFGDQIDYLVEGNSFAGGKPSTIVSFVNDNPILIREGPINFKDILETYNLD